MKPAEEILDALESTDDGYIHYSVLLPVITNLLSERDEARNQAIDDCLSKINKYPVGLTAAQYAEMTYKDLESLKTIS